MATANVAHGRRKGQARTTPEIPVGMQLADGTDLRQVTVLSKGDWERIQNQLNKRSIEEARIQKAREEREAMRLTSKEMVKNWNNTIMGQRQKKLEGRKLREQKEEEERKLIDIEEAKFQSQKRREAIEKAKTQQYYQTDRVKGFHGALLLTEVLKEREAQIELRRLKERANSGQDRQWLERARIEYEEGIRQDQHKASDRINAAHQNAGFLKAQISEHMRSKAQEEGDEVTEGKELRQLAAQYSQEKQRLTHIHSQEARGLMAENLRQISDVYRMKDVHQEQDEEEDEECRIFAAAKRKMMILRAAKERELHVEKQERLEKIREKLYAQMQQKIDDEADRIESAERESVEKQAQGDAVKEAKTRKMLRSIAEHRHEQMHQQELQASENRLKQQEMMAIKKEADMVFRRNEEEKSHKKFSEAKNLQNFHVTQMSERERNAIEARQEQLAQDKRNRELISIEEEQFHEYASKVIDHCDRGGRNVYPLVKAAKEGAGGGLGPVFPGKGGIRPSYMVCDKSGVQLPKYQRGTTEDTKQTIYGNEKSSKRLGFVW